MPDAVTAGGTAVAGGCSLFAIGAWLFGQAPAPVAASGLLLGVAAIVGASMPGVLAYFKDRSEARDFRELQEKVAELKAAHDRNRRRLRRARQTIRKLTERVAALESGPAEGDDVEVNGEAQES